MKHTKIQEIYRDFGPEKVITGIDDTNIVIKYIDIYGIFIPLILIMGDFNFLGLMKIMRFSEIAIKSIFILIMLVSILIFLYKSYTICFNDNNIIVKNKLNKKKVLDVNNYPRIYMQYTEIYNLKTYQKYKDYDLHFQQNNTDIVIDMRFFSDQKLKLLLNNLNMKEKKDVTLEQWELSANKKEKKFSEYSNFLEKKERIIGVKNSNLKLKIMNNKNLKLKFWICFLIGAVFFWGDCMTDNLDLSNALLGISVFWMIIDFFIILFILENWKSLYIKVSYPSDNTIKINKHVFDYKENNIILSMQTYTIPGSGKKEEHCLKVFCNNKCQFSINLNLKAERELGDFIYNLKYQKKSI